MIPHDKALHLIAGVLVFVIAQPFLTPELAMIPVVVAAIAKEVYDSTGKGNVEIADALWTVAGGLLGLAASLGS